MARLLPNPKNSSKEGLCSGAGWQTPLTSASAGPHTHRGDNQMCTALSRLRRSTGRKGARWIPC